MRNVNECSKNMHQRYKLGINAVFFFLSPPPAIMREFPLAIFLRISSIFLFPTISPQSSDIPPESPPPPAENRKFRMLDMGEGVFYKKFAVLRVKCKFNPSEGSAGSFSSQSKLPSF